MFSLTCWVKCELITMICKKCPIPYIMINIEICLPKTCRGVGKSTFSVRKCNTVCEYCIADMQKEIKQSPY